MQRGAKQSNAGLKTVRFDLRLATRIAQNGGGEQRKHQKHKQGAV